MTKKEAAETHKSQRPGGRRKVSKRREGGGDLYFGHADASVQRSGG